MPQPAKIGRMIAVRLIPGFAVLVSVAACQPPSLIVDGGNGKTVMLTAADLSKLPQQTINTAEQLRGEMMSLYLLVEAADGYRAVFAMQELDPGFTDRKIYLVTKRAGKPLSDKEGPFRIVYPDEKRPARWVRQVTALRIRQAN